MKYLVISIDPESWHTTPDKFSSLLRAKWPNAKCEPVTDPRRTRSLDFKLSISDWPVEGGLDRDGDSVAFEGDLDDCIEIALWCRSIIPSQYKLIFCDEGYNSKMELSPSATRAEILSVFCDSPDCHHNH